MRYYAKLIATATSLILVAMAETAFAGPIGFFQGVYHDFFGSTSPCPSDPSAFWNYCQGTFTDPRGGGKYVGEWKDNRKNGQGTETRPDGYKYVGEWRDNFKNGRGTLTFPSGDKYIGEFKDDRFDGQGTYVSANGGTKSGIWKNGELVDWTTPAGISIMVEGGTFIVPVTINGKMTLNFTIDTGASDVAIPADVVSTLMRTGSITKADFLGQAHYQLADGSIVPSAIFVIRSLTVGDKVVENVRASVTSAKGDLLLGQSFLSRFSSWSVDNKNRLLFLN